MAAGEMGIEAVLAIGSYSLMWRLVLFKRVPTYCRHGVVQVAVDRSMCRPNRRNALACERSGMTCGTLICIALHSCEKWFGKMHNVRDEASPRPTYLLDPKYGVGTTWPIFCGGLPMQRRHYPHPTYACGKSEETSLRIYLAYQHL